MENLSVSGSLSSVSTEDLIRERAYLNWEAAGSPEGDGIDYWLEAEQEIAAELEV